LNLNDLFHFAIEQGASDALLAVGSPPALRIGGALHLVDSPPLTDDDLWAAFSEAAGPALVDRFKARHELDFAIETNSGLRVRGNAFIQRGHIGLAFRIIPDKIPSLAELGLPPVLEEIALHPQGLIIVSGPTGEGKSTTLAAMIDIINSRRRAHIITIEDPIEHIHRNQRSIVDQREVGTDTDSFATGLRGALRQMPDVILVGEVRDLDSIAAALTAAETGHLVLTTLHTNDAVQSIDRLIDVFPAHQQPQIRLQVSFTLLAMLSQRLLPRADGKGRVAATELLRQTPAIANLIREGQTQQIYGVMETQQRLGMHTMDCSVRELYRQGIISYDEARLHVREAKTLAAP
jgi:twitching motility protein PilT